jgi:hypothetical protein
MFKHRRRNKTRVRFRQAMADGVDDEFPTPDFESKVDDAISTGGGNDTAAASVR